MPYIDIAPETEIATEKQEDRWTGGQADLAGSLMQFSWLLTAGRCQSPGSGSKTWGWVISRQLQAILPADSTRSSTVFGTFQPAAAESEAKAKAVAEAEAILAFLSSTSASCCPSPSPSPSVPALPIHVHGQWL